MTASWWWRHRRTGRVLDLGSREEVAARLYFEGDERVPHLRSFTVLMALSTVIATFGIANDSAAVVIGAMLVAPLMAPLLGLACGLTMGWPTRQLKAAVTVAAASFGAIGLAWLAAKTFAEPQFVVGASHELLSRTKPGTLDISIALAAGAYVTVQREAVSALPGAAIAVALIPPLPAVGISLEIGRDDLASGAILLYVTNLAGIVLAAAVTFILTGVVARRERGRFTTHTRWRLAAATLGVLALAVPLETAGRDAINTALDEHAVSAATTAWVGSRYLEVRSTTVDGSKVEIDSQGRTPRHRP